MRTVLTASLVTLLMVCAGTALAAESDQADVETPAASDAGPSAPPAEITGQDAGEDAPAGDSKDIMQNFTRHRPGACPEGPPCKVED
jgi:hypothetical protein